MVMLDKRFLDELRSRLVLSEIIGKRIKLTRAGREFKACCPFHGEKTPSFYINDGKGFYHCFGCGAHGDAVSFRMRHDNLGFGEAVEGLAAEAGMEIPKADPRSIEKFDEQQRLIQIMDRVAKWFEAQLHHPQNGFAMRYVRERGLSADMIAQFRLGYAPNSWDALRDALIAEGIKPADLIKLGILKQSTRADKADKPYSFFRGRIMFPVTDARGRIIAFGGRHLDEAFAGQQLSEKPPKYINSAESPLFNKSAVLYGLARARAQISESSPLILVEGYMDVIALAQYGFSTAVAPLGTALTEEHMQTAWKVSPAEAPPFLCFDGDNAGQNAAIRALDRLLPHFTAQRSVRVVFMPKGEDPDSLLKAKGATAVRAVLEQSLGVFDTLWQKELAATPSTPEGQAALQVRMDEYIKRLTDPLLQSSYRQALRDRLYQMNRKPFQPFKKQGKNRILPGIKPSLPKAADGIERRIWQVLLAAAINHPFLLEQYLEDIGIAHIPDPNLELVRENLINMMHEGHSESHLTSETIKQSLSERGLSDIVTNLLDNTIYQLYGFARPDVPADIVTEGWKDVWTRLQLKTVSHDKTKLLQEVRAEYSDETADRLFALSQQEQHIIDDI